MFFITVLLLSLSIQAQYTKLWEDTQAHIKTFNYLAAPHKIDDNPGIICRFEFDSDDNMQILIDDITTGATKQSITIPSPYLNSGNIKVPYIHRYLLDNDDDYEVSWIAVKKLGDNYANDDHAIFCINNNGITDTLIFATNTRWEYPSYSFIPFNGKLYYYAYYVYTNDYDKRVVFEIGDLPTSYTPQVPNSIKKANVNAILKNDDITISMDLKEAVDTKFSLFDSRGRNLIKNNIEKLEAGVHKRQINMNPLANGVYYLESKVGNETQFHKISKK